MVWELEMLTWEQGLDGINSLVQPDWLSPFPFIFSSHLPAAPKNQILGAPKNCSGKEPPLQVSANPLFSFCFSASHGQGSKDLKTCFLSVNISKKKQFFSSWCDLFHIFFPFSTSITDIMQHEKVTFCLFCASPLQVHTLIMVISMKICDNRILNTFTYN